MSRAYWLSAVGLTAIGGPIVWFVEPETHADTAYALWCMIVTYAGAVAMCVGFAMLVMNDAVERLGRKIGL